MLGEQQTHPLLVVVFVVQTTHQPNPNPTPDSTQPHQDVPGSRNLDDDADAQLDADDNADVKQRVSHVVKEFAVLERLMRGYEQENAKLAAELKHQRKTAAQAQGELRAENTRLQHQVRPWPWMVVLWWWWWWCSCSCSCSCYCWRFVELVVCYWRTRTSKTTDGRDD